MYNEKLIESKEILTKKNNIMQFQKYLQERNRQVKAGPVPPSIKYYITRSLNLPNGEKPNYNFTKYIFFKY